MAIHFDTNRRIIGCSNTNYLLEKSRVINQDAGERNYHAFYQLSLGAPAETRDRYQVGAPPAGGFKILEGGAERGESENFTEMMEAASSLGMADDEMDAVLRVTAAILHLGELEFADEAEGEGSTVVGGPALEAVAELLQINGPGGGATALGTALVFRTIQSGRGSVMKVKLNAENAKNARNSMMMNMYSALFDWLIRRVNQAVAAEGFCDAQIGVLDIFGFEIFEHNGFEQLCINYANEMLQLHFNTYTFQRETELYKREGINFEMVRVIAFLPTATTTRPSLRPPSLLVSTHV